MTTTIFTTIGDLAKECEAILRIAIQNRDKLQPPLFNAIWEYLSQRHGMTTIGKLVVVPSGVPENQIIRSTDGEKFVQLELYDNCARAFYVIRDKECRLLVGVVIP